MKISPGIPEADREMAAVLYWDAFGSKLGKVMGPRYRALLFIRNVLQSDHGICAHDNDGRLMGVVGFKTMHGALVGGDFADMRQVYGLLGATWRSVLLALLERDTENRRFLMDGIFVAPDARGRGVGTALLNAISDEAKKRGYQHVRLDVIDTNRRARALYLHEGFTELETRNMGLLRLIFGFSSVTTMIRAV